MKLEAKAKMPSIHFGEDDRWQGRPLYQAVVERCRKLDIRGATAFQGTQGYGASTRIIPALDEMISEGLIAMSDGGDQVRVIRRDGIRRNHERRPLSQFE